MQMATWGDYDRDPRWRVITTSYLALVEGDLAVQAGDDAADALWFKVNLKQESIIKTDISQPKFNLFPSSFKIKIDNPTIFDV